MEMSTDEGTTLGQAIADLIEAASRDEQGLSALEKLRDALTTTIDARRAEAEALAQAEEAIEPMDKVDLAALIDRASKNASADGLGQIATAMRGATGMSVDTSVASGVTTQEDAHAVPTDATVSRTERDAILPGLAERARLKADLSRACAKAVESGVLVEDSLIHRARSAGATTWMADLTDVTPHDLLVMADCFAALSETAEYLSLLRQDGPEGRERFPDAVRSLAAVVSALRIAVLEFRQTADEDQLAGFDWLRDTTAAERIYVERHMRLDDPYDPEQVTAIIDEIHDDLESLREVNARQDRRKKALGRVRYHAGLVGRGRGSDHDKAKIVDAVEELVADGLPPSSLELRDVLLPIRPELPDPGDEDCGYCRVLAELDLHLARLEAEPQIEEADEQPSPQVAQVAELIRGTELVVLGGEVRVEAETALRDAFGLSGLTWLHLDDNPTNEDFSRAIARENVSVVVLLIRWARHRYGDAKEAADLHDKPFVRVPGGYNPNSIAAAIMNQASERLSR